MGRFIVTEHKGIIDSLRKVEARGQLLIETVDNGLKVWNENTMNFDFVEYRHLVRVEYYNGFHILLKNTEEVKKLGLDISFDGFHQVIVLIPRYKMNYEGEFIADSLNKLIKEKNE